MFHLVFPGLCLLGYVLFCLGLRRLDRMSWSCRTWSCRDWSWRRLTRSAAPRCYYCDSPMVRDHRLARSLLRIATLTLLVVVILSFCTTDLGDLWLAFVLSCFGGALRWSP